MRAALVYPLAGVAGCFAIWAWWRGALGFWLLPGIASLVLFGWLLVQVDTRVAGRAFAACPWGRLHRRLASLDAGCGRQRPDLWDLAGAGLRLVGAAVILAPPRAG